MAAAGASILKPRALEDCELARVRCARTDEVHGGQDGDGRFDFSYTQTLILPRTDKVHGGQDGDGGRQRRQRHAELGRPEMHRAQRQAAHRGQPRPGYAGYRPRRRAQRECQAGACAGRPAESRLLIKVSDYYKHQGSKP